MNLEETTKECPPFCLRIHVLWHRMEEECARMDENKPLVKKFQVNCELFFTLCIYSFLAKSIALMVMLFKFLALPIKKVYWLYLEKELCWQAVSSSDLNNFVPHTICHLCFHLSLSIPWRNVTAIFWWPSV